MRVRVIACALLLSPACALPNPTTPSSDGPWRLSGTVSTNAGAKVGGPIVGAELQVVKGVNTSARVWTDSSGHFVFETLEPGRFTMTVSAAGHPTASPVVDLYRNIDVSFALQPR